MLVCGAATACKATIATARRSPRCLSISIARGQCTRVCSSGVLLPAQPHAVAGCRSFSSTVLRQMAASSSHEALKRDFGRWLRGELALLAAMLAVGVSGVYVYQNRENAPVKRITRLLALAEQSAQEGDREQALKHTLHAYDSVKSINRRDHHLFELAFAIAAQYESLGRGQPATKYYLDALEHLNDFSDGALRVRNRIVTLDRIAQCYDDRRQIQTAEKYYRLSVAAYDEHRGKRALSPRSTDTAEIAELRAIECEIPAVLHNYGHHLLGQQRWTEAKRVLQRASRLGRAASISDEELALINRQLDRVQDPAAKAAQPDDK